MNDIEKIIEKELERYARENWEFNEVLRKEVPFDVEDCKWCDLVAFARHFAQWGAKHLADDSKTSPNDLEEAAEKYSKERAEGHILYDWVHTFIAVAKWQAEQLLKSSPMPKDTVLFSKGVEEGKRLMMGEAVEGEVVKDWDNNLSVKSGVICGFKFGEKVRVIVLPKED